MATVSANRLAVQINGRVLEAKDELHRRKLEALAKFVRSLLVTPEGKNIAKIILYGSVARGEAEDDSDIDVLVFTLGNDDAMENVAHDVTWETMLATREHVPVIAFPLNDYYYHESDFFLWSVLQNGKEIYAMTESHIRRETIKDNLELARDYIASAELNQANGRVRAAIDTAYNAAELVAKSFLLLEVKELPTRHGRVIGQFSDFFIFKKQIVPPEWGHKLNVLLDRRHKARYVWKAVLTDDMAAEGIALARDLAGRLNQYLADTADTSTDDSDEQKDNP